MVVFGKPRDEKNGEMIYPCPFCKEEGTNCDDEHLKINVNNGKL